MKVYQINSVCGYGSTGRIVMDLADTLRAGGDECRIGYGRGTCTDPRAFRFASDLEVKLHGVLSRITDRHGFYSNAATKRLIADIRAYEPDVIHLHNLHGYYLNVSLLFSFLKTYGKPVVWTLHDCWAFTGHCAYFDYAGCSKWKTECHNCQQKKKYPASFFADHSRQNYRDKKNLFTSLPNLTLVTPSQWLYDLTKQSYLGDSDIRCIPNGIDLSAFYAIPSRKGDRLIILGAASVWDERKGLQDFILLRSILSEKYEIVLVGLEQDQIDALPKGIQGIRRTNNVQELAQLYRDAFVFVNPTYEDNFPTTNLEALACGTPVITYDTGGSPESIDETCGIVVKKGSDRLQNVKALSEAIINCNLQRENCAEKGARFEKKLQFQKYVQLYREHYLR